MRHLIGAVAVGATALAQPAAQGTHPLHTLPVVPLQLLEHPTTIQAGIARAHDDLASPSAEARAFYDQGLAYLHHFAWIEAARSFNQALRLDPRLALAHLGLSYAHTALNQSAPARAALERAGALASTPHDWRHLSIRQRQLIAMAAPHDARSMASYRQAIDEALAEFPSDAELWLRRGVAEASDPADSGQGAPVAAIRYFEQVLMLVPDHFAAHHYLTHAYENRGDVAEALRHGAAYAKLAPKVPHARHMHGHNLRRVGRIEDAIAEFDAAHTIESASLETDGLAPEWNWHYEHNLDLLGTSYQYIGQPRRAEAFLKEAFSLPTANLVQAVNKRAWPVFLRARGRADEALAAAAVLAQHPHPVVRALGHIEAGYARLMKRQFADAAAESNRALAAMKSASEGAGLVAAAFEGLQGEFLLRTDEREKGRRMLEAVATRVRAAPGPDEWTQALFTLDEIARAAREVGDWELARRMARQMLEHDPSYAAAHYALALAAEGSGDRETANREWALAEKYWSGADPGLPELRDIRIKRQTSARP